MSADKGSALTNEDAGTTLSDATALHRAAAAALAAPSVYNTQPWQWSVRDGALELFADRRRQLAAADPDGRMLTISCGTALHFALTALAAQGVRAEVASLPDVSEPELLARIRPKNRVAPTPEQVRHYQAIQVRSSDRRPFDDQPVSPADVDALRGVVESHGVHLHTVPAEDMVPLIVMASTAADVGFGDPALRKERATWTHRPVSSGDGVPTQTTVPDVPRRVRVRPFASDVDPQLPAGEGTDRGTLYAVYFTDGDDVAEWLRTGEALGATLLTAVELGLAASIMSDVVEIPQSRAALSRILSGVGHPQIMARFGHTDSTKAIPTAPRRQHDEAVTDWSETIVRIAPA